MCLCKQCTCCDVQRAHPQSTVVNVPRAKVFRSRPQLHSSVAVSACVSVSVWERLGWRRANDAHGCCTERQYTQCNSLGLASIPDCDELETHAVKGPSRRLKVVEIHLKATWDHTLLPATGECAPPYTKQADQYSINLPWRDRRLSWPRWFLYMIGGIAGKLAP